MAASIKSQDTLQTKDPNQKTKKQIGPSNAKNMKSRRLEDNGSWSVIITTSLKKKKEIKKT